MSSYHALFNPIVLFESFFIDTLDQLTEWAVEKFSSVRNLGISPPAYLNSPWTSKEILV